MVFQKLVPRSNYSNHINQNILLKLKAGPPIMTGSIRGAIHEHNFSANPAAITLGNFSET